MVGSCALFMSPHLEYAVMRFEGYFYAVFEEQEPDPHSAPATLVHERAGAASSSLTPSLTSCKACHCGGVPVAMMRSRNKVKSMASKLAGGNMLQRPGSLA